MEQRTSETSKNKQQDDRFKSYHINIHVKSKQSKYPNCKLGIVRLDKIKRPDNNAAYEKYILNMKQKQGKKKKIGCLLVFLQVVHKKLLIKKKFTEHLLEPGIYGDKRIVRKHFKPHTSVYA